MNWLKYWWLYGLVSGVIIFAGGFSLVKWGLVPAVDFTGGSLAEYQFKEKDVGGDEIRKVIEESGLEVQSVQKTGEKRFAVKMALKDENKTSGLPELMEGVLGEKPDQLAISSVGPAIGEELLRKTVYAILLAAGGILVWVAVRFGSFKYGVAAVLAMFHDSLVLLGGFSLLGHFAKVEVDGLFVTAMLTTLSFSVHDTIVVYDRIRELKRLNMKESLYDLANMAFTETMVRSVNNSLTIVFMLAALALLGGETVRWFVVALLIGTVTGTYSSPFVATPLVLMWNNLQERLGKR